MEKDPEIKGEGNSYTTEFRQYDPRLGRWMSLDPLMSMFPDMSPYVAFANNPIFFTDPYGLAPTNGGEGEESGSECDDGKATANGDDGGGGNFVKDLSQNSSTSDEGRMFPKGELASNNTSNESTSNGWGNYQDSYDAIGRKAHSAFADYMLLRNAASGGKKWETEKNLPPPIKPSSEDGNLRPDLLYIGNKTKGSVWELKPLSYLSGDKNVKAMNQIGGYVNRLNQLHYKGKAWSSGSSNGNEQPFYGTTYLERDGYKFSFWVADANKGLIVYKVLSGPEKEPQRIPVPVPVRVFSPVFKKINPATKLIPILRIIDFLFLDPQQTINPNKPGSCENK
jgi:RHS repeat-associated protein